jgi:steroid delta-isomerase-like uncharacterized protein
MPATTSHAIDETYVREVFARFNDPAAFFADPEATWIDHPRYYVVPDDLRMDSREQVLAWFRGYFDAFPDLTMEVEEVVIAGEPGRERVTVRWHVQATFSGAPLMGIEATGRRVDMRGMDLIEMQDGRVAGNTIYYDGLSLARQIGLLPAVGSVADQLLTRAFNATTQIKDRLRSRGASTSRA